VIDTKPRTLSDKQKNALKLLANQVVYCWICEKNAVLANTQLEFKHFIELSQKI
jgi:hypothetical protein